MKSSYAPRIALTFAALASGAILTGCYVMPASPEVYAQTVYPSSAMNFPPPPPPPAALAQIQASTQSSMQVLSARMYPANDKATQTGVLNGTITATSPGKGRFLLNYKGETLSGEATRVDGDARRGVASAYGTSGAFMSCEYQMETARHGAGTCTISDGAKYQVHVGQ